jgi:hypothetical protein
MAFRAIQELHKAEVKYETLFNVPLLTKIFKLVDKPPLNGCSQFKELNNKLPSRPDQSMAEQYIRLALELASLSETLLDLPYS